MGEQVVVISRASWLDPVGIGSSQLFGVASEIEIRAEPPIAQRAYLVEERRSHPPRHISDDVLGCCPIDERYSKEDRRFSCRVLPNSVCDVLNFRTKTGLGAYNLFREFSLMNQSYR